MIHSDYTISMLYTCIGSSDTPSYINPSGRGDRSPPQLKTGSFLNIRFKCSVRLSLSKGQDGVLGEGHVERGEQWLERHLPRMIKINSYHKT